MTSIVNSIVNLAGRDLYEVNPSPPTVHIHDADEKEKILAALKPAMREGYHVPLCMKGTRESVFMEINRWLEGTIYHTMFDCLPIHLV